MKINKRYYGVSNYLRNKRDELKIAITRKGHHEEAPLSFGGQLKGMFQPLATTIANVPRIFARYKNPGKRLEDLGQGFFGVANLVSAVLTIVVAVLQLPVGLTRDILGYLWSGLRNAISRGEGKAAEATPLVLFTVGGASLISLQIAGKGIISFIGNLFKRVFNLLAFIVTRLLERTFLSLTWIFTAAFTAVRGALQIALWPVALVLMPIRELRTWRSVPEIVENHSVQKAIAAENVEEVHARFEKNVNKGQLNTLSATQEARLFTAYNSAREERDVTEAKNAYLTFFKDHKPSQRRPAKEAAVLTATVEVDDESASLLRV